MENTEHTLDLDFSIANDLTLTHGIAILAVVALLVGLLVLIRWLNKRD